jgi:hypothetical protein
LEFNDGCSDCKETFMVCTAGDTVAATAGTEPQQNHPNANTRCNQWRNAQPWWLMTGFNVVGMVPIFSDVGVIMVP